MIYVNVNTLMIMVISNKVLSLELIFRTLNQTLKVYKQITSEKAAFVVGIMYL